MIKKRKNVCDVRMLLPVTAIYLITVLLMLPSLILSGYIRTAAGDAAELCLLYYMMIVLVFAMSRNLSSTLVAAAAASLGASNVSQALMWFACHADEQAAQIMAQVKTTVCFHICTVPAAWCLLALLDMMVQKHWFMELLLAAAGCAASAGVILLFSGRDSATSTIGNIQPALPVTFLALLCFALSLGRQPMFSRVLHALFCCMLLGSLVVKHELGLPILSALSCAMYYLLLYPTPKRSTLLLYAVTAFAVCVGAMLTDDALLLDTLGKIQGRVQDNDQIRTVLYTLKTAGWFGHFSYDVKVPAASTDFALANSVHYFGYAYLLLTGIPFLLGCFGVMKEEAMPHGYAPSTVFRGLCTVLFFTVIMYNLAMSLQLVPMIGVQAFFTGKSGSFALVSGLLLGCISFDAQRFSESKQKLTEMIQGRIY